MTAPVSGMVQQLAVKTVGGVVTPAQTLLVIVPSDSRLEIEAMVSNRDIGFVQPATRWRSRSIPSTSLGTGCCTVRCSASHRMPSRAMRRPTNRATISRHRRPHQRTQGPGMGYAARISLDRTQMQVEDKTVNLSPGMAVTAEIKTGSRRIIGYLLSPLMKYRQESLRER